MNNIIFLLYRKKVCEKIKEDGLFFLSKNKTSGMDCDSCSGVGRCEVDQHKCNCDSIDVNVDLY